MLIKECTSLVEQDCGMYVLECPNCPTKISDANQISQETTQEPTPDQICNAIMGMLRVLRLLKRMHRSPFTKMERVPFAQNVLEAVKAFDTPEIRNSLVERLYYPEKYVPVYNPNPQ